jgi:LPS sulfotransferase NodH
MRPRLGPVEQAASFSRPLHLLRASSRGCDAEAPVRNHYRNHDERGTTEVRSRCLATSHSPHGPRVTVGWPVIDSYLLCATPRSGSTLLCGLLRSTGVAGRPESYFRREDRDAYAAGWGVPRSAGGALDVAAFVRAAVTAGSTPNGVFGARIMWGTMTELTDALASVDPGGAESPLARLTAAFGRPRFLHLHRTDTLAQAVSWARAEQTHFWHPGDEVTVGGDEPRFDRDLIARLVDTIDAHEAAWRAWFENEGVSPHEIAYEDLAADPVGVTQSVLDLLGLVLPADRAITVSDRRQADALNADWVARFRD